MAGEVESGGIDVRLQNVIFEAEDLGDLIGIIHAEAATYNESEIE